MTAVDRIEAEIFFTDGTSCKVLLSNEGIQRWGAEKPTLALAVTPTEAMQDALFESDCYLVHA